MASRNEIIAFLDDLLEIGSFSDYGPNGLQVPGATEVTSAVTGVSAQLVLCHPGLFWDFHPRTIRPAMKERLRALFDADLSLKSRSSGTAVPSWCTASESFQGAPQTPSMRPSPWTSTRFSPVKRRST